MSIVSSRSRIVIDTNVFVSAIVFGGKPRQVINVIAEDAAILVMTEPIIIEIRRVVVTKFIDFVDDLTKIENLLEEDAEWVKAGFHTIAISRDPDDDKFIEAAMAGDCQYIVSGDKDLLDLKEYQGVKIVNVSDFLKLIDT
jgi:putative PIN family toxin of toxin-antitoxin system